MACFGLLHAGMLSGCAQEPAQQNGWMDLAEKKTADGTANPASDPREPPIPTLEASLPQPASPPPLAHDRLVSLTVTDKVPLRDVLLELARDAQINVEIDPRVKGGVIFSAYGQPFDEVLRRLCALGGLRARMDGTFVRVEPDTPYQKSYPLDYLSLARRVTSQTDIATNVFDVNVASGSGSSNASLVGSLRCLPQRYTSSAPSLRSLSIAKGGRAQ